MLSDLPVENPIAIVEVLRVACVLHTIYCLAFWQLLFEQNNNQLEQNFSPFKQINNHFKCAQNTFLMNIEI